MTDVLSELRIHYEEYQFECVASAINEIERLRGEVDFLRNENQDLRQQIADAGRHKKDLASFALLDPRRGGF